MRRAGVILAVVIAALGAPAVPAASAPFDAGAARAFSARVEVLSRAGRWDEARATINRELSSAEGPRRAALLVDLAALAVDSNAYRHGDPQAAAAAVQRALAAAREAKHEQVLARATFTAARLTYWRGFDEPTRWDEARPLFEEVQRAARAGPLPDESLATLALFYRGLVEQQQGHAAAARPLFEDGLARARRANDGFLASFFERHLAADDEAAGRLDDAERRYRTSLKLREEAGATVFVAFARVALAGVLARRGRVDEALPLWRAAAADGEKAGSDNAAASAWLGLGEALFARGDVDGARAALLQADARAAAFGERALRDDVAKALAKLPGRSR